MSWIKQITNFMIAPTNLFKNNFKKPLNIQNCYMHYTNITYVQNNTHVRTKATFKSIEFHSNNSNKHPATHNSSVNTSNFEIYPRLNNNS